MATIILDRAASNTTQVPGSTELTPQDGDIYILQSDAINEFRFLGDADFEVQIEDAGPYAQDSGMFGPVALSFEDTTNPTCRGNGYAIATFPITGHGASGSQEISENSAIGVLAGAEVESEMTDFVMQMDVLESGANDQSARGRGNFVEGTV